MVLLTPISLATLFVQVTARYKVIKRGFKGLLGIVEQRVPTIPACAP